MWKRIFFMLLTGLIIIQIGAASMTVPESYRWFGTQSYYYSATTPQYAEEYVENNIEPLMELPEYQRAEAIVQLVVRDLKYDYTAYFSGSNATKRKANNLENFFLTGYGMCWCYSRAYVFLCREAGLEAYEIVGYVNYSDGSRASHAWACVIVHGDQLMIDPTFAATGAKWWQWEAWNELPNHTFTY